MRRPLMTSHFFSRCGFIFLRSTFALGVLEPLAALFVAGLVDFLLVFLLTFFMTFSVCWGFEGKARACDGAAQRRVGGGRAEHRLFVAGYLDVLRKTEIFLGSVGFASSLWEGFVPMGRSVTGVDAFSGG